MPSRPTWTRIGGVPLRRGSSRRRRWRRRRAVRERHALAEVERPLRQVGARLPALGQAGSDLGAVDLVAAAATRRSARRPAATRRRSRRRSTGRRARRSGRTRTGPDRSTPHHRQLLAGERAGVGAGHVGLVAPSPNRRWRSGPSARAAGQRAALAWAYSVGAGRLVGRLRRPGAISAGDVGERRAELRARPGAEVVVHEVGRRPGSRRPSRAGRTAACRSSALSMNVVDSCRSRVTLMPISASWAWMSVRHRRRLRRGSRGPRRGSSA